MPFSDCIAKIPLSEEESRIYNDLVAKKVAEGIPEEQAQRESIEARLGELDVDKADVFATVNESVGARPSKIDVSGLDTIEFDQEPFGEFKTGENLINAIKMRKMIVDIGEKDEEGNPIVQSLPVPLFAQLGFSQS